MSVIKSWDDLNTYCCQRAELDSVMRISGILIIDGVFVRVLVDGMGG